MSMRNFFVVLVITGLFVGIVLVAETTQNQGCLPWKQPVRVGGGTFSEHRGHTYCK
jgi:hypothetical protein